MILNLITFITSNIANLICPKRIIGKGDIFCYSEVQENPFNQY